MTSLTVSAELEIKLRLPRDAIPALLHHHAVAKHKAGRARRRRLVSTYFDTPKLRLASAGVGLRIRRDGRRWIQTVKGPPQAQSGGGLTARPEYEWPLGGSSKMPPIDTARLATTPWRRILLKAARAGLAPLFVTDFERTEMPLSLPAATTAVLCADIGTIHAINSKARSDICEIELELHSGKIEPLFALASSLAADLPLSLEPASKAARGVHLVSPPHASPRHAENPELPRDVSASEALASIIRVCLRQIEGNIDGVLNDDDAEWIHQMRIGTRRLRACLSLVRDGADSDRLARLIGDVKRLACALGAVRDLDVLALETLPAVRQASRDDAATAAALRSFTAKVNHRRRIARTEARAAVASRRFVQTILAASAFAATPAHLAIRMSAREFASRLLARRQRKLLRRGAALPEGSAAQRHAARIAAKKLRYAAEFFSGLFPGRRARAYRKALTRLQDVLGALNDATVAVRLAREFAGPPSSAAATLQGWAATQSLAAAGELAHTWRDFSRCKPFWD